MAGYIGSKVAVVSSGAERKKVFTATSGQTSFTGLSYTVNNVHVFHNGVRLVDGTDYTATNGNSITLTVGAATDDQVVVVSYNTFQTSDTVSASTGGTFAGDVNFTGAFTSQGIDDNATSTAMTLDGSGNLLVGTTNSLPADNSVEGIALSPQYNGGIIQVSRTGQAGLTVNRRTSDGDIALFKKDGTTVGSIGTLGGVAYMNSGDVGFSLDWGSDQIKPRQANGANRDAAIDLGASASRFKDLYLSGGVYLGGTGSANKLDDYEEGTWTPTVQGTTTAGTSTYSTREASYVKIGRQVTVTCNTVLTGFSGAAGSAVVTGLPFASASGFGIATGAFECDNIAFSSGYTTAYVTVFGGQSVVSYRQHGSSRTEAAINVTQVPAGNW